MIINLKDLIPLMEQGKTNREIAKLYRVKPVTIAQWIGRLKKAGVELPQRQTGRPKKLII